MNLPRPIFVPIADGADRRRLSTLKHDVRIIRTGLVALVTMAVLVIGVAAGAMLAPTAIAIVLALVLAPVANALERLGLPGGLAAPLTVVATVSVLVLGTLSFAPSVTDWAKRAPQIVHSVELKLRPITRQFAALENASQQITHVDAAPRSRAVPVVTATPVGGGIVETVATSVPDVLAKMLYVTVLTIFLLLGRRQYTEQLILLPRQYANRLRMARICRDVKLRVSGYLFTLAMINIGLAVTTAICFTIAGVPDAVVWGIAYGILNFIPIIGPTTIILFSAAVGFVTANTLTGALLPTAILLTIDTIEAYFVQPWLLSRRLVVSPIAIFVMVATLVWMWGAPAAITAVPLLILIHTVMMNMPNLRPFALLLATQDRLHGQRRHIKEHRRQARELRRRKTVSK
jgi:predicted PurR-regulated permease PerM